MSEATCPICGEKALFQPYRALFGRPYVFDCNAICGTYWIEHTAYDFLKSNDFPTDLKVKMCAENIRGGKIGSTVYWSKDKRERHQGEDAEVLGQNLIYKNIDATMIEPIEHSDKPYAILQTLAHKLRFQNPFATAKIEKRDWLELKIADRSELFGWIKPLIESRGFIKSRDWEMIKSVNTRDIAIAENDFGYALTPEGWLKVAELGRNLESRKVLIAMKFTDNPDRAEIQDAMVRACKDTGWEAFTIDQQEYIGGISDAIISKINQSRFVLAEFTGQNHGVYYEAGYAHGRDVPVIQIVKESDCKSLHFDTRHLNHIVWRDFDDLYKRVKDRIGAVINRS